MKSAIAAVIGALVLPTLIDAALADDHGQFRRHERDHRDGWRGDIHRFHERDFYRWRSGHWRHGRHDGRLGWWWIVGGVWYFYPTPVYPYPDPYQPPLLVAPSSPATPQYWYYCPHPAGYYPYVSECPRGWQRVPAEPLRARPLR